MAQSIKDISLEAFEIQIFKIKTKELLKILENLFKYIKFVSDKISYEQIKDLERKQTKIWKELNRRGIKLDKKFYDWLYKKHKKRIF